MKTVKNLLHNIKDEIKILNSNGNNDFKHTLLNKVQFIIIIFILSPVLVGIAVLIDLFKILKRSSDED